MFTPMEWNQVEAALMDQLDRLAKSERMVTPGTFEADCVTDAIRYTGSALTKVQVSRYGVDDDDGLADADATPLWHPEVEAGYVPEAEMRALWGDR